MNLVQLILFLLQNHKYLLVIPTSHEKGSYIELIVWINTE
jgi:hypothetical protein